MSTVRSGRPNTLWEQGRRPGRLVATTAASAALAVALADLLVTHTLSLAFDAAFVAICVGAAFAVRPRDFFVVWVLPPLLMAGLMAVLSVAAHDAIAQPGDGPVQSVVSGSAHHARALVVGYLLTVVVLALRLVAQRNAGRLRRTP